MEDIIFNAKIIKRGKVNGQKYVVLNETTFYPDGKGGQLGDRGTISHSKVLSVKEKEGEILHFVDQFPLEDEVNCVVSGKRRMDISVHHTAQHILSGAFMHLFNIETSSFHMGEKYCTIDIAALDISKERVRAAEELANKIVMQNIPVKKYFVTEKQLEKLPLRKKHDVNGKIRIVEIPDFDISMCGGTHVDYTGEIGIIKVLKYERVKKVFQRIYFVAGMRALRDYERKTEILSDISSLLTTGEDELLEKIKSLVKEQKNRKKEITQLKNTLFEYIAEELVKESKVIGTTNVLIKEVKDYSKEDLINLSKRCKNKKSLLSILYSNKGNVTEVVISKGNGIKFDLSRLKEELSKKFELRGGGNSGFMMLEMNRTEGIKETIEQFIQSEKKLVD